MDLRGGILSRWRAAWHRSMWLWTTLLLAAGTLLPAPGVRCQNVSFTFRPQEGDAGYVCSTFCRTSMWEKCVNNSGCAIIDSALQIIVVDGSYTNFYMSARYMRQQPVRLWNASFWTFFVLRVSKYPGITTGDGLTFLIAPNATVPEYSDGGDLGLFLNGTDASGAPFDGKASRIVAVMFDTFQNFGDPLTPYVGLLVNSIKASASTTLDRTLPVDFFSNTYGVWVEYDATSKLLEVSMLPVQASRLQPFSDSAARELRQSATSMLTYTLDIADWVAEVSYLGFSAGGGYAAEVNEILYWQFRIGESKALPVPAPIIPTPAPAPSPALAPPDANHGGATPPPPPDALAPHDASHGAGLSPTATAVVAVAASLVGLAAISGAVVFCCCWRKHISRQGDGHSGLTAALHAYVSARKFSYDELRKATDDFAHTNMLGRGGFGIVFRGQLKDGTSVAVKRISEQSTQGEKEFLAEVTIIGRLHHKNLVPLLGWCQNPKGELLLVYEFMPNGSLDHHVLPQSFASTSSATNSSSSSNLPMNSSQEQGPGPVLSWDARFHILQGVASGLLYLHEDWQEGGANLKQAVVHRDIKSSNVMLDADWNGRLGDFGLARLVEKNRSAETASAIVGTRGYLAPEYPLTRKISVKADVYSFGVLVLEVVTGRPPVDWRQPPEKRVLVDWIRSLHLANERLEGAADPTLRGAFQTQQMVLLLQLGLMCTADDPADRPSMRQVVQSLASSSRPLLVPSSNVPFSNPSLGGRWSSAVQQ